MRVLGINTGTSVDGVDLALIDWDLHDLKNFKIIAEASYEFDPAVKKEIEILISKQKGSLEEITQLHYKLARFIAFIVNEFRLEYNHHFELIGMHGQTVYHGSRCSLQLGNHAVVAKLTGITTIGDFRAGDIAVGGNGAPLTSYIDDVLIRDEKQVRATLNIGGIANISVMEPEKPIIAYDTGPGNTLIDCLTKKLFKQDFDKNGVIASRGKINDRFIDALIKRTDYFDLQPPKSTGRECFDEKFADKFLDLGNKENIIANVTFFTCRTITNELKKFPIKEIYVAGGGFRNQFLMDKLKQLNPEIDFKSHDEFGIRDQFKEAMLFSLLAFTSLHHIKNNVPSSTGAKKATILGVLANP